MRLKTDVTPRPFVAQESRETRVLGLGLIMGLGITMILIHVSFEATQDTHSASKGPRLRVCVCVCRIDSQASISVPFTEVVQPPKPSAEAGQYPNQGACITLRAHVPTWYILGP